MVVGALDIIHIVMNYKSGWSSLVITQPSASHHLLCAQCVYVCVTALSGINHLSWKGERGNVIAMCNCVCVRDVSRESARSAVAAPLIAQFSFLAHLLCLGVNSFGMSHDFDIFI